jgi:hypothetical protein
MGGVWLLAQEDLGWDNASLVVYAHQEPKEQVEKNPKSGPYSKICLILR